MSIKILTEGNNGTGWSYEESVILYALKMAGKTYSQIAEILNDSQQFSREFNDNICKKKYNDTDWVKFFEMHREKQDRKDDDLDIESDKERVLELALANQSRIVKRDRGRTQIIIDSVKNSIYKLPKPRVNDIRYTPKTKQYSMEHIGVVISDIHCGASYTLRDTGGLSEFNLDICKQRANILKENVLKISGRHKQIYEIPELHVFCLGDIVAGMNDVGSWSAEYIDSSIYDQMIEGSRMLRDMIATWSEHFDKLHFYGVYGNHGKVAKRGVEKDYVNWDYITYSFMQESLQNYKNIEWNLAPSWWMQKNILGHNFYLTHGTGIKSSMGMPYYGMEKASSKIAGLLKKDPPDYIILGHFHSTAEIQTNNSKIICNGSFLGGDMYSLRDLHRMDTPEQKMFGIHKDGITWTYNIRLKKD